MDISLQNRNMRILIAHDFGLVRSALRCYLAERLGQVTIGEAACSDGLLEQLDTQSWDVLMLDVHLQQEGELALLGRIRANHTSLPVILMSFRPKHPFAIPALKAGAMGYLTKEDLPDQLPHAITKVMKGGRYINSGVAEKMATMFSSDLDLRRMHEKLSQRELMIMLMLSQGITSKRIANHLNLSINTVSTYRCRALRKLNMQSNAEFIQYAIRNGLLH